ncbi:SpoIIE family protein phosphatase [Streptomyces sp. NPDC007896]|uniref:PP2C family protein-serine/threonine phosphatase n=1 Tax=Streptomyces sp. NPDC007896 TaxID=3364784 RepID=UPI0036F1915D
MGATCLYAVYDPVAIRCTLARAGHVLPAVVTRDGTVNLLELPAGPPLGLGGLPFETAEIDLPEGSLIALYTDGLIEVLDHDIEAGLTRLCHALARSSASLEATCDTVLEALLPADRPHHEESPDSPLRRGAHMETSRSCPPAAACTSVRPTQRHHPARPTRLHMPRSRFAPDPDNGKPWAPVLPQAPAPTHPCPRWS